MKWLVYLSIFLVCYFLYGFYINQFDLSVVQRELNKENSTGYFDYKGVLNVHTSLSLGSSGAASIIESAQAADLDFIIFTDLNIFPTKTDFSESYHGHLLTLFGGKYSYLDSRFIYYNKNQERIGSSLGEAQIKIADLLSQNNRSNKDSLLIMAHPFDSNFSWKGELAPGIDGIELINIKSLSLQRWAETKLSTIWSLLIYPFNSRLALIRLFSEPENVAAFYDQVVQKRKLLAFAGSEASAKAIPLANYFIEFPTYVRNFELASNHVLLKSELTGNFQNDKQKIFNALKDGNFYLAFDIIGDPKGFLATMEEQNKKYLMGSSVPLGKKLFLKVKIPHIEKYFFEIIVYKNGEKYKIVNSYDLEMPVTEKGVYRVQVRVSPLWPFPDAIRWISWIYTNPFYVESF